MYRLLLKITKMRPFGDPWGLPYAYGDYSYIWGVTFMPGWGVLLPPTMVWAKATHCHGDMGVPQ
jgi:hypothetical protein